MTSPKIKSACSTKIQTKKKYLTFLLSDYIILNMSNRLRTVSTVTMDDIAEELGVSKSTVSRALAGSGRISKDTVQRVREFAKSVGFKPNLVAKALAGKKTFNIAAVLPFEAVQSRALFFHEVLSGMTLRAEKDGYSILLCIETLKDVVQNKRIDAAILTQVHVGNQEVQILTEAKIPFVVIGELEGAVSVDSKMKEECADFTRLCLEKCGTEDGDVLFVCGSLDVSANANRLSGFLSGMEKSERKSAVCTDFDDFSIDKDSKWRLVLCSDDVVCVRVIDALRNARKQIGTEVLVASFHDSVILKELEISALCVDVRMLGETAAETAIKIISGKEFEQNSFVPSSFNWRKSTENHI